MDRRSRDETSRSGAISHWDVMTVDEPKAMPVAEWALPDCVLLLWVFGPSHLARVLSLWLRGDFFQGDLPGTSSVHSTRAC